MLVMVLDGTFHKAYGRGLLANDLQSYNHKLDITRYIFGQLVQFQEVLCVLICTLENCLASRNISNLCF